MDNTPQFLSTCLILLAFVFAFRARRKVQPMITRLKKFNNHMRTMPAGSLTPENFNELSSLANDGNAFWKAWNKFTKTFIQRPTNIYASSIRPIFYFTVEDFECTLQLKRLAKWSGLLVGIGLLLTFLGLVAALESATQSISAATAQGGQNAVTMQEALKNLLHAATFKFFTSIFGLLTSLAISWYEKYLRRVLEALFDEFREHIEERIPLITTEQLENDVLIESRQQTQQLKIFNTEMAEGLMNMSAAVINSLEKAVAPVHQELTQVNAGIGSMDQSIGSTIGEVIGSNMRNMQEETLKILAEKMSELMNKQAGTEINQMASTLLQLTEALGGMRSALDSGGGAFAQQLEEAARELRAGITELSEAARRMSQGVTNDVSKAQTALVDNLRTVGEEMTRSLTQIREAAQSTSSSVTGEGSEAVRMIQEAVERMVTAMEQSADRARAQTEETAEGVNATLKNALEGLKSISETARDNMREALESTRKEMDAQGQKAASSLTLGAQSALEAFEASFSNLQYQIAEMAKSIEGMRYAMNSYGGTITDASKESRGVVESMRTAAGVIQSAVDPLDLTNKEISTNLRELQKSLQTMTDGVRIASAATSSAAETTKTAGEGLKLAWNQYENRFKGVDEGLGRAMEKMVSSLDANVQQISKYVTDVDQYLGSAANRIAQAIEDLGEVLEDTRPERPAITAGARR